MSQSPSRPLLRVIAIAIAAIPFVFGVLRALRTGSDFRYLVTAFASFGTAAAILRCGTSGRDAALSLLRSVLAVCGATLVAAAVAFGLGARSVSAVLAVACGFSTCATAGLALWHGAGRGSRAFQAGFGGW